MDDVKSADPKGDSHPQSGDSDGQKVANLQASLDYVTNIVNTFRESLLVLDEGLRVIMANESFYKTFQVKPEETQGRFVYDLGNGQWDIPALRELLERILPQNTHFDGFEVKHRFEDLGERVMRLNARRLRHDGEKILLVIEDITEGTRAIEAKLFLGAIVESSEDSVITVDFHGNITTWNKAAEHMYGYRAEEAIGQPLTMLNMPGDFRQLPALIDQVRHSKRVAMFDLERVRKNGQHLYLSVQISPIKDDAGNIVGVSTVSRDITERKRAEERLEQAVQERTAQLRETVTELEHFSYSIIHDMRAPLRAMQGFSQLVMMDSDEAVSPASKDYLRRVVAAAERMDHLIRDALNYSKVMLAQWNVAPVDILRLLRSMVETYPNMQPPKAIIHIDPNMPRVLGNESALTQCFSNLLNNAVKFVAPDKTPQIRVRAEPNGDYVRLWFEDNGIGIPAGSHERIFEMFQRLDKRYEGTGIGLAIVRKVVQRLGGQVGVESEPGKGSRFWLDLRPARAG